MQRANNPDFLWNFSNDEITVQGSRACDYRWAKANKQTAQSNETFLQTPNDTVVIDTCVSDARSSISIIAGSGDQCVRFKSSLGYHRHTALFAAIVNSVVSLYRKPCLN